MSDRIPFSPISPEAIRQAARGRYPLRAPDAAEASWFASQPNVAGYAAPVPPGTQRHVVLNPSLPQQAIPSVHANEGVRHFMYESGVTPDFVVYPHQHASKEYANDPVAAKQTIVARILAGDPSLAPYTSEQQSAARNIGVGLLRGLTK